MKTNNKHERDGTEDCDLGRDGIDRCEHDQAGEHYLDEHEQDEAWAGKAGKKVIDPLTAAGLPTGAYLGGFKLKAMIPGRSQPIGKRRILGADVVNCYHVMSRTTGGDMLFDDLEKEAFVKIMLREGCAVCWSGRWTRGRSSPRGSRGSH